MDPNQIPQQQQPYTQQQPAVNTPPQSVQSDDTFQKLIPTKNMQALLSYYFGIFGIIPFIGLPFAVTAIILGYLGLSKFKTNPTPGAKGHALTGLILGWVVVAIWVVIIGLILLSAASES